MVKKISAKEFKEEALQGVSVVDFSATWCGPCNMLAPVLEEVAEEMGDQVDFYKVDIDEDANLAMEYGIVSVPSLLVLKDGVKQDLLVGFKPKEVLMEEIRNSIA